MDTVDHESVCNLVQTALQLNKNSWLTIFNAYCYYYNLIPETAVYNKILFLCEKAYEINPQILDQIHALLEVDITYQQEVSLAKKEMIYQISHGEARIH